MYIYAVYKEVVLMAKNKNPTKSKDVRCDLLMIDHIVLSQTWFGFWVVKIIDCNGTDRERHQNDICI